MLFKPIQHYIQNAIKSFDSIPFTRKMRLEKISRYVQKKLDEDKTPELIYICTHNSRRSHFGQIWGKVAASYYGIQNANTYSAGTEATAFNPNAISAIEKAGFKVFPKDGEGTNPHYALAYHEKEEPIICYSKTYKDISIPQEGLCAIMTCAEADENCPLIPGIELRISCPYDDPKDFDGTPWQEEKYNERCMQIAVENLYIFSLVKSNFRSSQ